MNKKSKKTIARNKNSWYTESELKIGVDGIENLKSRINVVYGHFGSGKTEFSINYALHLKKFHKKVALIDLDIINLYFRIREKTQLLEKNGIEVYASGLKNNQTLDLPALDPSILKPLQDPNYIVIVDAGGDPKGSLVLRRYRQYFKDSNNIFVVNANRTETDNYQKVLSYIREIESYSSLKATSIINTTHMLKDTKEEDVLKGYKLCKEIEEKTNLVFKYNVAKKDICDNLKEDDKVVSDLKEKLFPIKLYFRDDWML
ncbi:MAG: ATP-binding protein [Tissierellia bacterium]|nr:ATP-binding protein [Tissierellia bacterium]